MQLDRIRILARREYLSRVRTKGFWLATLALPLLIATMAFLPSLLLSRTKSDLHLVIVDATGRVAPALLAKLAEAPTNRVKATAFEVESVPVGADATAQRAELDRRVLAGELGGWLWISSETLADDEVEYHAESVSNFVTLAVLERAVSEAVRSMRFTDAGLDPEKVSALSRSIDVATVRVAEGGSRKEGTEAGMILAYVLFFLLYVTLAIYGAQVLNGVLEEKTSRVVEVVVSTVQPFELMMGKLTGIGLAGLTQLGIWVGSLALMTAPGIVAAMSWIPAGVDIPSLSPLLLVNFLLFFVLGFFLYASFYAAVGAAFNNLQEAQQISGLMGFLFAIPAMFFPLVLNDPDSTLVTVASFIPPLTPLLMMLRIAVKAPPLWQLALSYVLTAGFTVFMIWFAGRIYRVGILMYGKKPTFQELWRWLRYA